MTELPWEKVKSVVADALERDPSDRAQFVAEACGGDEALKKEVDELLAAHEGAPSFLDEVSPEHFATSLEDQAKAMVGTQLGPYRLDEFVARGGMGSVFRGSRTRDYEQTVAIKLLDATWNTPEVVARFLRERETLARLRHPNIAAILDGGTTADGVPYIVMEFVDGCDILEYCEQQQPSLDKRLELMQEMCAAVQEAHRKLVVHRDLKPANILVTEEGRTRLLDFGIAKALGDGPASDLTQGPLEWMTPDYASPEQVRGEEITTATDIYALGVIFYEVLTGQRPYRIRGTTRFQIEKEIVEREAPAPSRAAGIAEDLGRRLRGDLDAIVLKCLSKDPISRYPTVAALSEDLRRHTKGLPVEARPDSALYRASKFLRRNTLASSVAALLVVSLVAGIVATTSQANRANRKAITSSRGIGLLIGAFEGADPYFTPGSEPPSARQVLETSVQLLADDPEFLAEPEIRRDLELGIGSAFLGLYEDERAYETLTRALAGHAELGGGGLEQARILFKLGIAARRLGKYQESRQRLSESVRIFEEEPGEALERLRASNALALACLQSGDREKARKDYESIEAGFRALLATDASDDARVHFASALSNMGALAQWSGDPETAIHRYEEALALQRAALGDEHPRVATTLNNLGMAHLDSQQLDAAERLLIEALQLRQRVLPAGHSLIALSFNNLADLAYSRGETAEALRLLEESLAMQSAAHGSNHPDVLKLRTNMASVLQELERDDEAAAALVDVLSARRDTLPPDHTDLGLSLLLLGQHRWLLDGDAGAAEPLLAEAVGIYRQSSEGYEWDLHDGLFLHGQVLAELGQDSEATAALQEAIEFFEANGAADRAAAARQSLP